MKKPIICPYKSSASGQCSHKGCKITRKRIRYCGYKNHYNCPLFIEWLKKARKSKIQRRNTSENDIGEKVHG